MQTAAPYVHIGLAPKQADFDIFGTTVLNLIEWEVRHETLIARRSEKNGEVVYHFIRIQGDDETVFFDI